MKIEIWSDIMCPFCYIGKRHFETALTKFADKENIEVEWKSFQLDPSMPEISNESQEEYLVKRKGMSTEQVAFTDERYLNQMKQDVQEAQNIGVRGVPFFVFDRKYGVSGAQAPEAFLETLEKSFAKWRTENPEIKLEMTQEL